ncbi:hypothetical protein DITRI_Ditri11bG0040100 [Diplodiscus trichospermus]
MEMVPAGEWHSEEGSSPIVTSTASAYHDKQHESNSLAHYNQSLSERKQRETCFRCRKQGHWAQDCPLKTPTKASSSQPSTPEDIHLLPVLRCHCGVACTICVSRSEANPGRRYYARNCSCNSDKATPGKIFFQWCDNVKALMCKCGAGACTINIQRDENGKETKYYTCRIRTGHGSCGFLQFPPSSPNSRPRSMEKDKRPSILSPQHGKPPNIMTLEDVSPIPSFSTTNIVVREAEASNFVKREENHVSCLMSLSDIRSRQIEFWNQISAAGNSPKGSEVLQIMGLHVHGWVGRLAFPPPRTLADPPLRHFFCHTFPLFDPILVSDYVDISDKGSSSSIMPRAPLNAEVNEVSKNALTIDNQLSGVPLGTSSLKRSFTAMQEAATNPILKEIGKNLQKALQSLLKSVEPPDDNTMLQAANTSIDVLASPLMECGTFAECTSRVAQEESTPQDNCNQQVPNIHKKHKNSEKCLDDKSGNHEETFDSLTASSNYLKSVHEVASHLKNTLHQIEKLETFLLEMSQDVRQSKRSMQAAYQELTRALKLPHELEEQCMGRTN